MANAVKQVRDEKVGLQRAADAFDALMIAIY
jgi:hypothetical protein